MGGGDLSLFHEISLLIHTVIPQPRLLALLPTLPAPPLAELLTIPLQGCCFKAEVNENLLHILRAVAGGATSFSRAVLVSHSVPTIHAVLAESGVYLSETEEQIVVLIAQGLSNGEIAAAVGLARQTVSNYIKSIYSKLHTNQRAELIRRFHGTGFVPWGK